MQALVFATGQMIDEMSQAFPIFTAWFSCKKCKVVDGKTDVRSGANR
jgi:hypothetical protein